ncbi:MAG: aspartyl protease family protein [Candidatus Peribacteraceae bacterium]|jgi:hypothetical protein|nr:hypothetical protein [bacterium]MDP6561954.1 aspartyl protease family protein [Candidatus Peribacteraceae bacterium]|tara:strand:- start:31273 stop:31674 length:402 start_codon:yes stop_codon:yes gene_type:complete
MEFDYAKREWSRGTVYVPVVPISLNGFPVGHALVDTGADATLFPMELNQLLDVELDREKAISFTSAGGEDFRAIPAKKPIEYKVEQSGFRPIVWKGIPFFVEGQPTILLGQYQCLSGLKITLDAPRRKMKIQQ